MPSGSNHLTSMCCSLFMVWTFILVWSKFSSSVACFLELVAHVWLVWVDVGSSVSVCFCWHTISLGICAIFPILVDFESCLLTYNKLGFLCVCICAIPLPVQNRAFQDGHCLKNNNPQHARRTPSENVRKHIFPYYCQGWFTSLPRIPGLYHWPSSCFPHKFYEHAMCSGCCPSPLLVSFGRYYLQSRGNLPTA